MEDEGALEEMQGSPVPTQCGDGRAELHLEERQGAFVLVQQGHQHKERGRRLDEAQTRRDDQQNGSHLARVLVLCGRGQQFSTQ